MRAKMCFKELDMDLLNITRSELPSIGIGSINDPLQTYGLAPEVTSVLIDSIPSIVALIGIILTYLSGKEKNKTVTIMYEDGRKLTFSPSMSKKEKEALLEIIREYEKNHHSKTPQIIIK